MARPPVALSTLRGFEAAARLASFALAANELHLSHSAVSHQIKLLEEELGQPLFRRVGRSVVLTDAGTDFARTVRDILHRLEDGVARLAPYQKPSGVILYTTTAFARGFGIADAFPKTPSSRYVLSPHRGQSRNGNARALDGCPCQRRCRALCALENSR